MIKVWIRLAIDDSNIRVVNLGLDGKFGARYYVFYTALNTVDLAVTLSNIE